VSATNRGTERAALDFYPSPAWSVDIILPHLPRGGHVVEPGCGDGAIIQRLFAAGWTFENVTGIELDPERAQLCHERTGAFVVCADYLTHPLIPADVVIGNPSYSLAEAFARRALEQVAERRGTVALLLRTGFASSQERAPFHKAHPSDMHLLPRRPSFAASMGCSRRKEGCSYREMLPVEAPRPKECPLCHARTTCSTTDASEYGWFLFGPGRGGRWSVLDLPAVAA
jgi:SAM-dependent methyltransferase